MIRGLWTEMYDNKNRELSQHDRLSAEFVYMNLPEYVEECDEYWEYIEGFYEGEE